jgi:hypothetical protein
MTEVQQQKPIAEIRRWLYSFICIFFDVVLLQLSEVVYNIASSQIGCFDGEGGAINDTTMTLVPIFSMLVYKNGHNSYYNIRGIDFPAR